jgi:hypothetical protein
MKLRSQTIQRNDTITYKTVGSTVYILDPKTNTIHTLNGTGSFIWNKIKKPTTMEALVSSITEEYNVTQKEALVDTQSFVKKYREYGYILMLSE